MHTFDNQLIITTWLIQTDGSTHQHLHTIVAAAKVVADFAKTNDKLVIRGGVYGGKALDAEGVKQLASIPSKEVLLAQLCGLLMSPISRTAVVLGALAAQKGEGEPAAAE